MLYPIVRPIAKLSLRVFYRKIYLSHANRIPVGKPVILACNHPTAFIEPCLLACFLERPLFFLVRGNLFKKSLHDQLLRSLNMLPIFRLKDGGYSKLKDNYQTFRAVFEAFEQNRTVMILAEGSTIQCKRLRPLQKGTARLALGALEQDSIAEVYVVPVGVNFTYAERARSEVMITFGEPLLASDYRQAYEENANQGILNLTEDLFPAMEACLVNVPDPADEELAEQCLQMARSEQPEPLFPIFSHSGERLDLEQAVANRLSAMDGAGKAELRVQAADYFEHLGQFGLEDRTLVAAKAPVCWPLWLGWPVYALAYLFHTPLLWPGRWVSANKVKTHEFVMPVRWAASMGTYLLVTIAIVLIALFSGAWWLLLAYAGLMLAGFFALYYEEHSARCRQHKRLGLVPERQLAALRERRAVVRAGLGVL